MLIYSKFKEKINLNKLKFNIKDLNKLKRFTWYIKKLKNILDVLRHLILVIFEYKLLVDIIVNIYMQNANNIDGTNQKVDLKSIENAGNEWSVTIYTNATWRGIVINLKMEVFT